ncbi:MAG TPA: hypothetical protein VK718_08435 [Ferruginibacter sp.]|jgi:hypothetical protein|nr:hypothetical protein [Ferruginibacter sp.]
MKHHFTTKIILSTAIIFASIATVAAQTSTDNIGYDQPQSAYQDQYQQPQSQPVQQAPAQQYTQQNQYPPSNQYSDQQSFYYYPDANVYYDPACNHYMYNDGANWLTVNVLPWNIRIGGLPRILVYHRGPQVWLDNRIHRGYYFANRGRFGPQARFGYHDNFRRDVGFNRGFGGGRGYGGGRGFGHHR